MPGSHLHSYIFTILVAELVNHAAVSERLHLDYQFSCIRPPSKKWIVNHRKNSVCYMLREGHFLLYRFRFEHWACHFTWQRGHRNGWIFHRNVNSCIIWFQNVMKFSETLYLKWKINLIRKLALRFFLHGR